VIFCGINPGRVSAGAAAHFANPRNDFWRLLHAAGFTPRLLEPSEQWELVEYGVGVTNAAYRTTPGSGDLRRADFAGSAQRLEALAQELVPAWIGFVGKEAYRGTFNERPELGLQERRLGQTRLFVLPSTSPANAAVLWAERHHWFTELAGLSDPVPRPTVRAILLDDAERIYLHRFVSDADVGAWICPGGAIETGEEPEDALRRELEEEVGLSDAAIGPWVWRRTHIWFWPEFDFVCESRERFAVVRANSSAVAPTGHDLVEGTAYREEHRWWSIAELEESTDLVAPRDLGPKLRDLLEHGPPAELIDVSR
jgi:TDG/mug DNA glycosylase family protein